MRMDRWGAESDMVRSRSATRSTRASATRHLSRRGGLACFGCVTAPRAMHSSASRRGVSPTVVAGGFAASASTGALIAMGRRLGSIRLPFAAIGATLAHATISSEATALVVIGLLSHVVLSFVWATLFVLLVTRGWRLSTAGAVTGIAQFALSWIVASVTHRGLASVLPLGDRMVLALVIAASCAIGVRVAAGPQNAPNSRGMHGSERGESRM